MDEFENKLLETWEEVFKKGQLSLWILLALKQSPSSASQIADFLNRRTNGALSVEDQSLYRALRRFASARIIEFSENANPKGPSIKIFNLTESGEKVLEEFIKRDIKPLYFDEANKELIGRSK